MLVGVLAGLVGTLFVKVLYATEDGFGKIPLPEWSKAALGGLVIGTIGIVFPHVLGVGYSTITDALNGQLTVTLLGVLLAVKILATSITIGSGGSGGVFAPSLFLGAMTGGFFGKIMNSWFPGTTDSGAYALITMGAMVAATTHAPLSAIIIIFELTQTIDIIPPVMAACVVSSTVAMLLSKESIYTTKLIRRGIDIHREDDPNVLKSLFVRDILDREPGIVRTNATMDEVLSQIVESDHTELFVVNERDELMGALYFSELRRVITEQDDLRALVVAGDLVEARPTVTEDDDLDVVMQLWQTEGVEELAVVAADDPKRLVGSVHKRDLINAYNQEVMRRDLAGGVATTVGVVDRVRQVDLGGGYALQEVLAPPRFIGRSLRELDLRGEFGVQVLLIRTPGADGTPAIRVPTPQDRIATGERLVVAGPKEAVERLS